MFVFAFSMIAVLCTLDIITTHYVISRLIGYESNEILASILGGWFYMFKYFATLSVVLGIAAISKNRKLEIVSYATLIAFYTIVVFNNMLVIFANTDLNLNLSKLFVVFFTIFLIIYTFLKPDLAEKASS